MQRRNEPIVIMILRILLGCVFIFSGLTKAIDPIANAIQFDDYFISFRMPFMQLFSMFMAICLTIVEFTLGVMMLLRIKVRLTSLFYLLLLDAQDVGLVVVVDVEVSEVEVAVVEYDQNLVFVEELAQ